MSEIGDALVAAEDAIAAGNPRKAMGELMRLRGALDAFRRDPGTLTEQQWNALYVPVRSPAARQALDRWGDEDRREAERRRHEREYGVK